MRSKIRGPLCALVSMGALLVPPTASAAPGPKPKASAKPKASGWPSTAPKPEDPALRGRLASGTSRIDPDSIFARQLTAVRPKSAGTLGALGSRTIEVSPGKRARIDAIASKAFVDHIKFRSALSTVKNSALLGGVTDTTEVYEFDRSYIVVRSTSVTVANPLL